MIVGFPGVSNSQSIAEIYKFHHTKSFSDFLLDGRQNHGNPDGSEVLENQDSWDHAQMKERKQLYNLAEWKPVYDQTRP